MNKKDYETLLGTLSSIGQAMEVHEISLKLAQPIFGNDLEISLPGFETDIVVLDISPPIFNDPKKPPPKPPKINVANLSIPVHSRDEALATAYGFAACTNFQGSSWPAVQEQVKADWQLRFKDVAAWESAEPRVRQAWNTLGSLVDLCKMPEES